MKVRKHHHRELAGTTLELACQYCREQAVGVVSSMIYVDGLVACSIAPDGRNITTFQSASLPYRSCCIALLLAFHHSLLLKWPGTTDRKHVLIHG